jgi:eukaryotic-like serine/threonine-protein kinase
MSTCPELGLGAGSRLAQSLDSAACGAPTVPEQERESLRPGAVLGDGYRILEKRAAGGMGEIYAADHVRRGGLFALKVLNPRFRGDDAARNRFSQEAQMLALAQHENVVRLLDFETGKSEAQFLAMEYLDGIDLAQYVADQGPMEPMHVAGLVAQIAAALELAHARQIVHGDIKPSNVMLLADGRACAKVLDFGVAHFFGQPPSLGTPAYMAPEQARGEAQRIDARTDQFALAALSHVLLTAEDPFQGDRTVDVLEAIVQGRPRRLGETVPWPAEEIESVLARALSKHPGDRFSSVSGFAAELASAASRTAQARRSSAASYGRSGAVAAQFKWIPRGCLGGYRSLRDRDVVAEARLGCQTTVLVRPVPRDLVA